METAQAVWISKGLADQGIDVPAVLICVLADSYDMYKTAMREIDQIDDMIKTDRFENEL